MPLLRPLLGCLLLLGACFAFPAAALCEPEVTILYTAKTHGEIKSCSV